MTQIGVFSVTSPMESANYRKGNLLSPPHLSYFALHSHSNTINPRRSTPSATIISQAKPQPSFGRERLLKRKPRSGNVRLAQDDVPTIFKINKALAIIAKSVTRH
ncbi:uncharacterized protein LOC131324158 [Rhododendron vialii]|uniref:uncharacterized protein LOC131324158 n=1 Tax=Rhododendron vialii TaxID=182163 RepID=UPI00265D89A3|nr:uncharacterized protein LOC131324158 [Rhododendron vialii]